jgi:hypothetical protein
MGIVVPPRVMPSPCCIVGHDTTSPVDHLFWRHNEQVIATPRSRSHRSTFCKSSCDSGIHILRGKVPWIIARRPRSVGSATMGRFSHSWTGSLSHWYALVLALSGSDKRLRLTVDRAAAIPVGKLWKNTTVEVDKRVRSGDAGDEGCDMQEPQPPKAERVTR